MHSPERQAIRDAERVQPSPWSKEAPDQLWDYLVVGSGMGGMTSAALLAKLGKRVLVLEQHGVPGGFTHTFRRHRYRWDVGLHTVGETTELDEIGRLLADLSGGRLRWASLGPVSDELHFPDGFRFDIPNEPRAFRDALAEAFPAQRRVVNDYLNTLLSAGRSLRGHYLARLGPACLARPLDWVLGRSARSYTSRRCPPGRRAHRPMGLLRSPARDVLLCRACLGDRSLSARRRLSGGWRPADRTRAAADGR
jgi:all-trans-retinol 13,14-reductase